MNVRRFKAIFQAIIPGPLWRRLQDIRYRSHKRLDKFKRRPPLVGFDLARSGGFNLSIALMDGNGGKVLDRY